MNDAERPRTELAQIVRIELRTKAGTLVMSLVEETRAAEDTAPQDSR